MTMSDHNPDFEVTVLGKRLLYNNDRKLYSVYRLVAVLMTLNEVTVLGKRLLYNNDRILYPVYRLVAVLMTLK